MILHAFYNLENVGDVLLGRITNAKTSSCLRQDDVCFLYDENKHLIGLNIFNASKYFSNLTSGQVCLNQTDIDQINHLCKGKVIFDVDSTDHIIVGQVVEIEDHPDSDHLHVCKVNLGDKIEQIVCGAANVELNQKVVVATVGTMMPNGLLIVPSKLRKVDSNGMLCSAKELNLVNEATQKGIMVLDNRYELGQAFFKQYEKYKGGN